MTTQLDIESVPHSAQTLHQEEFSGNYNEKIATNSMNEKSSNETLRGQVNIATSPSPKAGPQFKNSFHRILVTFGLVFGILIGTISETAVSTVTEKIGSDLQSFGSLTWIAGGYMLTVVAFTPLCGKLSDIFGRKPVEITGITIFAVGCLGCALSSSMILLIVFRVIAGIGGGCLMSMSFIMVSDVIPMEQRSAYLSLVSMTFAISNIIGPIVGGLIAEISWRIIFYILLPICLILALLVIFVLDLPKSEGNIMTNVKRVDFLGSISLICTIVTLILATNWGGKDYAWNSAPIIVLFVLMVVFLVAFIYIQMRVASEPILPGRVFVRNVVLSNIANLTAGAVNFVTIFYLPVYFQTVHNATPSVSGYHLIPFLVTISIFCMSSSYLITVFKTIRGIMWVGGIITIVGVCLVAFMRQHSSLAEQVIFVMINGMGLGLLLQLIILVCQLSVQDEDVAIATGFITFTTNIGGVIGLAIVGSVYNNILAQQLAIYLPNFSPEDLARPHIAGALDEQNKELLRYCYFVAFRYGYICMIPFAIICAISVFFITKVAVPSKEDMPAPAGH
jgi:multidrug resistance protein